MNPVTLARAAAHVAIVSLACAPAGPMMADAPVGSRGAPVCGSSKTPAVSNQPSPSESVRIVLDRTSCLGWCPNYSVEILGNGEVTYEGRSFVRVEGTRKTHVAPAAVHALLEHFARSSFRYMQYEYRHDSTDEPTLRLSLSMGGRTKTVLDYPPCHTESGPDSDPTPPELCTLEREVDELAQTKEWTQCRNDAGPTYCRQ